MKQKGRKSYCLHAIVAMMMAFFMIGTLVTAQAQTANVWATMKGDITMFMANDLGRNGYYDQKPIAELMGKMAKTLKPKCVLAAGDIHHFNGIASVNDPLWNTNCCRTALSYDTSEQKSLLKV